MLRFCSTAVEKMLHDQFFSVGSDSNNIDSNYIGGLIKIETEMVKVEIIQSISTRKSTDQFFSPIGILIYF